MNPSSPPLVKTLLIVFADMLAIAGGIAMYLRTESILWVLVGVFLSGSITMLFLVPMLRAAAEAKKATTGKGGNLVH